MDNRGYSTARAGLSRRDAQCRDPRHDLRERQRVERPPAIRQVDRRKVGHEVTQAFGNAEQNVTHGFRMIQPWTIILHKVDIQALTPEPVRVSAVSDPTLKGIIGTPKAEVDTEERKQRREKPQKRSSMRRKQSR